MKRLLILGIILIGLGASAAETVNLTGIENEQLKLGEPVKTIKGSLLIEDEKVLNELLSYQREKDIADMDALWQGTVANNRVIEFALKKLATPESQQRIHSSLMAKTLSAVVSGTSFVPSIMGSDPYIQTASFAVGRLAQTLLNKKNIPQQVPLTDTELIELAGLVENLQDKLVSTYYEYKNSLVQLKEIRARLLLYNKNYSKALENGDILDIAVSSNLYDNMLLQEYYYEQQAKKYHLELQRLAGKKAVDGLSLYAHNFDATLYDGSKKL